ncbi:MAG: hypothetical protein RR685_02415 [Hungatella sp.]
MKILFDFKNMEDWKKKKILYIWGAVVLIGVMFLAYGTYVLSKDRMNEDYYWDHILYEDPAVVTKVEGLSTEAVPVTVGTYIENLKELSLKSNYYRVVFLAWFKWDGSEDLDMKNNFRIYKGYMNKMEVVKDYHENGQNYQLVRCDVSVTKNYWTRRFPLDSQQLKMYLESSYPVTKMVFLPDTENSKLNTNLNISGYGVRRYTNGVINFQYDGTHGDPELTEAVYTSEFVTALEINRDSWGTYVKCFIALLGTTIWVLITLFINTYHRIDPLGMLPAALFGTVSNIMVGANLLPDALEIGLLEYVNFWGIFTILAVAFSVININRIRNKYEDKEFAGAFGRLMFWTILILILAGHILLPISAYMFD